MFRLLVATAVAFAAWTAGYPAAAQDVDAEELDLARQVLNASRTGRAFDGILPDMADRTKTTFIQTNPQMQLGVIEVVDKVALDLVPRRADLDTRLTEVWAAAFDKDELRALLDFYNSPVGKKFSVVMTRILAAQVAMADEWGRQVSEEMVNRVRDELTAMAQAEAKKLEADPGGGADPAGQLRLQAQ